MATHLRAHRAGFGPGLTEITALDDQEGVGIGLSVLRLDAGAVHEETAAGESAWLLMHGEAAVRLGDASARWSRESLFDQAPSAAHACAGTPLRVECLSAVELVVCRTASTRAFAPRLFAPEQVPDEARGKGLVGDASLRLVRTIFDDGNSEAAVELVLGEVVTLPGRWSSYPPHHHPQPELYHYRFTDPHGYGHAELGDEVLKVGQNDTVKILPGRDHAQVAAPGYGMYYVWVIRHLPGARYRTPEFTEQHAWTMQPGARFWWPRRLAGGDADA